MLVFKLYKQFASLVNLKFFSDSTFYRIQRDFIAPVIRKMWRKERKNVMDMLRNKELVVLIGDGRCDSPGHSAKYCTYTLMESSSGMVVDTVVIPVTDAPNSNAMEKAGFIKAVETVLNENIKIDTISTDGHVQIRKMMRVDSRFNGIQHQFDPWHVAKEISKKLNKVSKKKSTEIICR